jgi:hypothetical protein
MDNGQTVGRASAVGISSSVLRVSVARDSEASVLPTLNQPREKGMVDARLSAIVFSCAIHWRCCCW